MQPPQLHGSLQLPTQQPTTVPEVPVLQHVAKWPVPHLVVACDPVLVQVAKPAACAPPSLISLGGSYFNAFGAHVSTVRDAEHPSW
jgi:hypothetical protein